MAKNIGSLEPSRRSLHRLAEHVLSRRSVVRTIRVMSFLAVAGLLLSAVSAGPAGASVTTWIRAYVDPAKVSPAAVGSDVALTTDGGYVVAGSTGINTHNAWIAKISAAGSIQWQKQVGCGASNVLSVQQTSDGGYILAGGSEGCASQCTAGGFPYLNCAWVLKLSSAGAVDWQYVYPGALQSSASQVEQTSDGGYVVAGSTLDTSGTNYAWIAKLSSQGAVQWQRQIGSGTFADAQAVRQTSDGGYIIAGSTGAIGSSSVLMVKLDASGDVQWQQAYGTGNEDSANSVRQTSDGGYIVAGFVAVSSGGSTQDYALLLKLGPTGAIQWQTRYDPGDHFGIDASDASSVRQTSDGGYVLAGTIALIVDGAPEQASWLAKTTSTGAVSWQHDYYKINAATGLPYPSSFYDVAQTSDGGFVAAGYTDEYNNSDNVWLVKTDASGNVASCPEAHTAASTALSAGLTASTPSLPVATPANAGTALSGGTTAATLTTHKDC
jgi:hypothetical protein